MKIFLDSSAFAKRFIDEGGSDAVEQVCMQASELGLSMICVPEIISALNRRRREGSLTRGQYGTAKTRLVEDARDADIVQLTASVIGTSVAVLEASPVRAMDALHVACAVEWGAEMFVSADKRQLLAARRAGLKTRQT